MDFQLSAAAPPAIPRPAMTWDAFVGENAIVVADEPDQRIAVRVTSAGCVSVALQDWRREPLQCLYLSNKEAADLARALFQAHGQAVAAEVIASAKWGEGQ